MLYKSLYVFVEGKDDSNFFERILYPHIYNRYNNIEIIQFAGMSPAKFSGFINSITQMNADYIILTDIDSYPCITSRKNQFQIKYRICDTNNIIIVVKEIEAWYCAGLDRYNCRKFGVEKLRQNESVTKETFNESIYKKYQSRIEAMLKILDCYDIDTAKIKSPSLAYFCSRFQI